MSEERVREALVAALGRVAPEADLGNVAADAPLREELELDSMDFLSFVIGVDERLGVAIPEADYPRLATLGEAVAYLTERLGVPST